MIRLAQVGNEAAVDFVIDCGADDVVAYLAPLLEAHGDRDNALRHLKAAVECNPVDVDARNDYALALFRVGAWAKAVEQILAALQVNPSHLSARKNAVRGLGVRAARDRERARHT